MIVTFFPLGRNVLSWIQPPPSTIYRAESQAGCTQPPRTLDPSGKLKMPPPNTKLGTLRSASIVQSRVVGLYLNEESARSLMDLAGTSNQKSNTSQSEARMLINFVTQWNELIVLTERDLARLEESWTGKHPAESKISASGQDATIYTMLKFASYMSLSWEIVREITYLAISKAAFDVLVEYAVYSKKHRGIRALSEIVRPCDDFVLDDAVTCLRSGTPSQILLAAVTCSSFALYSLPERQRPDYTPPTEDLGFGCVRHSRLRAVISKFPKTGELARPKKLRFPPGFSAEATQRLIKERDRAVKRCKDINFVRITEQRDDVSQEQPHEVSTCPRCRRLSQSTGAATHIRDAHHSEFSSNGMAIVESLDLKNSAHASHDVCLFAIDECKEIEDQSAIARTIEDLLKSGSLYHTIRHPIPIQLYEQGYRTRVLWSDTIWNLPLPLRPPTNEQRRDISNWISELRGADLSVRNKPDELEYNWNNLQLSLHFLNKGSTWEIATQKVNQFQLNARSQPQEYPGSLDQRGHRRSLYDQKEDEERELRKAAGKHDDDAPDMTRRPARFGIEDAGLRKYHGSKFQRE